MASNSAVHDAWFNVADANGSGVISGKQAVKFFGRSGLSKDVLAKVWALADFDRGGTLDRAKFGHAVNLIYLAQKGEDINSEDTEGAGLPEMAGLEALTQNVLAGISESTNPFEDSDEDSESEEAKLPQTVTRPAPVPANLHPAASKKNSSKSDASKASKPQAKLKKPLSSHECTSIIDGLKHIYFNRIKKIEEEFKFGSFFSPCLTEGDFHAKPQVLLLGQYSTGKTTFIKHLLGNSEYPGTHIGPEPTTDRFVVVHHGHEERRTPGNTLAVQPDKPYQGLTVFGSAFLGRLEGSQCDNPLLDQVTLIDTPGVLSGEKQRIERSYDFIHVCEWFAARSDLILLLFDPYKLDISDEFKSVIHSIKGHDDKVRIVLNKADQVDSQQLMRVYGALMWSLGKVFATPEVVRVYIGSFNTEPPSDKNPLAKELFEMEQEDLLRDLYKLPERSCDRKVNEFVKRLRALKIHTLIISHLRKQMPALMGKKEKQLKLLINLDEEFAKLQKEEHLPPGDFPDVDRYRNILQAFDLAKFSKMEKKQRKAIDETLNVDIPRLVKLFENPF